MLDAPKQGPPGKQRLMPDLTTFLLEATRGLTTCATCSMDNEKRTKFLDLVTANPRLPPGGLPQVRTRNPAVPSASTRHVAEGHPCLWSEFRRKELLPCACPRGRA